MKIRKVKTMKQTMSQAYASKVLRLNQWGKIAITIFSDAAIEYAIQKLKNFKDVRHPYKYFISEAKQYCIQRNIEFNYKLCNTLQEQYKMPADVDTFVESSVDSLSSVDSNVYKTVTVDSVKDKTSTTEPQSDSNSKYYTHKEVIIDYDNECRKWHEMVVNWDSIVDVKKKCAKGYELTYPSYLDWLKKIPLSTFLDSNPPDILVYMDESKSHSILDIINGR